MTTLKDIFPIAMKVLDVLGELHFFVAPRRLGVPATTTTIAFSLLLLCAQGCELSQSPFLVVATPTNKNQKGAKRPARFPEGAYQYDVECVHEISLTATGGKRSDFATLLSVSVRTNSPFPITVRYGPETLISWFGSNRVFSGKSLASRELFSSAAVDRWAQRYEFILQYPNGEQQSTDYYLNCSLD
jgi:hypothetical protein